MTWMVQVRNNKDIRGAGQIGNWKRELTRKFESYVLESCLM